MILKLCVCLGWQDRVARLVWRPVGSWLKRGGAGKVVPCSVAARVPHVAAVMALDDATWPDSPMGVGGRWVGRMNSWLGSSTL